MKPFNIVLIIILILGITLLLVQNLLGRRKHVPKSQLSEQQKCHLFQYGLLHFTTPENAKSILSEKKIKCGNGSRLYSGVKNYTWYVLCTEPINNAYIDKWFHDVSTMRPNSTICIHIIIDNTHTNEEFLINKISSHIAHIGDLKGKMTAYRKVDDIWTIWKG